jgi:hypothetical protein
MKQMTEVIRFFIFIFIFYYIVIYKEEVNRK